MYIFDSRVRCGVGPHCKMDILSDFFLNLKKFRTNCTHVKLRGGRIHVDRSRLVSFFSTESIEKFVILATKKHNLLPFVWKKAEMEIKNNDARKVAHGLSLLSHASEHEFEVDDFAVYAHD